MRFTPESSKAGYQHVPDVAMTKFILCILLSATAVQAGDAKDSHRDAMEFCNQFVILDPAPASASATAWIAIWTIRTTTGTPIGADAPTRRMSKLILIWPDMSRPFRHLI